MSRFRTESDSMGQLQVPEDASYGAQTQRAVDNFPVSGLTMPRDFLHALGLVKKACAMANNDIGALDQDVCTAITSVCDQIVLGKLDDQFPVDVFQTGSGTSTNMNANEVIAHIASADAGLNVHPNDHVNMSQSSNDVIPSCIHVSAAVSVVSELLPALEHLKTVIDNKAESVDDIVTTGRTHLMDAMPVTLGQELSGWSAQVSSSFDRIKSSLSLNISSVGSRLFSKLR